MKTQLIKYADNGFLARKPEYLSELSMDAEGVLIRMANLPECDYITADELSDIFPADSKETLMKALNELVNHEYLLVSDENKYACNKIKLIETMFYVVLT